MVLREINGYPHAGVKLNSHFTPTQKLTKKCSNDLNIRAESIKF